MNTTILLIALIVFSIFSAFLPKTDYEISFGNAVSLLISFFIGTYITYYLFNALDFGFTLTYPQVMFIYLLCGKANLCNMIKCMKEKDDLKK